jgi:hypothetical protein
MSVIPLIHEVEVGGAQSKAGLDKKHKTQVGHGKCCVSLEMGKGGRQQNAFANFPHS